MTPWLIWLIDATVLMAVGVLIHAVYSFAREWWLNRNP
jgi:hypothetical protein